MNEQKKALLIIGSPKVQSTSASLGTHLLSRMWDKGLEVATVQVNKVLKSDEALEETIFAINKADLLVMAFPLYVDAVPFPMVKLMELIAERRKDNSNQQRPRMLAIVNCGFPEAHHNDTALAICRRFAKEAGIDWAGGLALGGGGAIGGQALDKRGGLVKSVKKSLELAADALINDRPLPEAAAQLMSKPLMPRWLYLWIGETGGKRTAKKNGALKKIDDRPYGE